MERRIFMKWKSCLQLFDVNPLLTPLCLIGSQAFTDTQWFDSYVQQPIARAIEAALVALTHKMRLGDKYVILFAYEVIRVASTFELDAIAQFLLTIQALHQELAKRK